MNYRIVPISLSVILTALLLTSPAWATVMRYLEVEDLARASSDVFQGEILSTSVSWNAERTRIYTSAQVRIHETFKGVVRRDQIIMVIQLGGEKDGIRMDYAGRPEFKTGETIVLFTSRLKSGDLTVVGLKQGKMTVQGDELTREFSGLSLVGMANQNRNSRLGTARAARMTMTEFRNRMAKLN
jgi:hypothetical protein